MYYFAILYFWLLSWHFSMASLGSAKMDGGNCVAPEPGKNTPIPRRKMKQTTAAAEPRNFKSVA
jgi:hypothetical protein